ncbi:MAG: hypothetical protein QXX41_12470 [Nitrososphaerota archaeon]
MYGEALSAIPLQQHLEEHILRRGSEDHIWLAGKGGGNFTFEEFIGDLKKRYDDPVHLLYTASGVRKIVSAYAIAVSAALTKHYGQKWRDFLKMAVFNRLIKGSSHPILKATLDGAKSLEEIGGS